MSEKQKQELKRRIEEIEEGGDPDMVHEKLYDLITYLKAVLDSN